jgi:hypothetical protein
VPKLAGVELSHGALASRLVLGTVASALVFFVYYFMPASLVAFASRFIPANALGAVDTILSSLVNPTMLMLGLFLTFLVFLSVVLGDSRLHGPIVILEGACVFAYTILVFQGGTISLTCPRELLQGLGVNLQIDLTVLMLVFLVYPVLTVIKGVFLALKRG